MTTAPDHITSTAPERIYLDLGDCAHLIKPEETFATYAQGEVTWSEGNDSGVGIPYVRADLVPTPAPAQPDPLHVANERGEGEDVKDAARYRWLRNRLPWTLMSANGYTRMAARLPVSIKADMDEAHEMDAALDAAMASGLSAFDQALAGAPKEKP